MQKSIIHGPVNISGAVSPVGVTPGDASIPNGPGALQVSVTGTSGGGEVAAIIAVSDNLDAQAPIVNPVFLATLARLTGFNGVDWDRLRALTDANAQASVPGSLVTLARAQAYNGASWDRVAGVAGASMIAQSGLGSVLVNGSGQWSERNSPAAAARATVTRAAVAGRRHVCQGFTFAVGGSGAAVVNGAVIRDGATGAGTILWEIVTGAPAGSWFVVALSGLNLVGSVNTAMTIEFVAAPPANVSQSVSMAGITAQA